MEQNQNTMNTEKNEIELTQIKLKSIYSKLSELEEILDNYADLIHIAKKEKKQEIYFIIPDEEIENLKKKVHFNFIYEEKKKGKAKWKQKFLPFLEEYERILEENYKKTQVKIMQLFHVMGYLEEFMKDAECFYHPCLLESDSYLEISYKIIDETIGIAKIIEQLGKWKTKKQILFQ